MRRTKTQHDAIGSFVVDAAGQRFFAQQAKQMEEQATGIVGKRRSCCIILPTSKRYVAWSVVLAILIIFFMVAVPMRFAFSGTTEDDFIHSRAGWFVVDVIADCLFIVDLVISFRTAIKTEGQFIVDGRTIALTYLRTWFLFDLIASIPTSFLELLDSDSSAGPGADVEQFNKLLRGGRIGKLLRVLRIFKLLRVARLSRSMQSLQAYTVVNPSFLRFVRIIGMQIVLWHMIACSYYFLAQLEGFCSWNPDNEPLDSDYFKWGGGQAQPNGYQECASDWVPWVQLQREPLFTQYIQAYFWAVQVTTGVGRDVIPQTDLETGFTIVTIVIGVICSAVIIGSLASALQNVDAVEAVQQQHIESVSAFLRDQSVPQALQRQIVDFYEYLHTRRKQQGESDLFSELPVALKMRLKVALSRQRVEQVALFRGMPPESVVSLIHKLRSMVAIPRQYLTQQGDVGAELFILTSGACHAVHRAENKARSRWDRLRAASQPDHWRQLFLRLKTRGDETVLHELTEGDFFGEDALLGKRHVHSVMATTYCDLLVLPVEGLSEVIATFPGLAHRLEAEAKKRERGRLTDILNRGGIGDEIVRRSTTRYGRRGVTKAMVAPMTPTPSPKGPPAAAEGPVDADSPPGTPDRGPQTGPQDSPRPLSLGARLLRRASNLSGVSRARSPSGASGSAPSAESVDTEDDPSGLAVDTDDLAARIQRAARADEEAERKIAALERKVAALQDRLITVTSQRNRAIGERYLLMKKLQSITDSPSQDDSARE